MDMTAFLADARLASPPALAPEPLPPLAAWLEAAPAHWREDGERAALAELLPAIAAALSTLADPAAAFAWLDALVCRVPPGTRLFATLARAPQRLADLCALPERAPRLAAMLASDPGLASAWLAAAEAAPAAAIADRWSTLGGPPAAAMAVIDAETHACRFAMEVAALCGGSDPLLMARANSELADGALRTAHRLAMAELAERHGTVAGGELVVLAMGRYGGAELTAQSDLDLVFLFTGDGAIDSDGRRSLDAAEYFDRAAVLITRHLASHSALGRLYEVDTRLRPWGEKGPRACSLDCLDRYLGGNAGVWEFMAMTRARPVIGSAEACQAVAALLADHDRTVRGKAVIDDARAMRMAIARHKPPRGSLDVKLVHGGLVDLEFAVHVNQLRHGIGCVPGLGRAIAAQVEAGLADPALMEAHRDLTGLLIALRLTGAAVDENLLPPRQAAQVAKIVGVADWSDLRARYKAARLTVQRALRSTLSQPGR